MRSVFFSLIFVLLCRQSAPALEGYYLEEMTEMPAVFGMGGGKAVTKTWITSRNLRRDDGNNKQTTIIQSDPDRIIIMDHSDTTYTELTSETFQGLAIMGLMMFGIQYHPETGKPQIPDPLFKKTGKRQKIGQWMCDERILKAIDGQAGNTVQRFSMWVGADMDITGGLYSRIIRKLMGDPGQDYQSFFSQLEQLQGYPVYISTIIMGRTVSQMLIRYEYRNIPDSNFTIPPSYRKKELNFSD